MIKGMLEKLDPQQKKILAGVGVVGGFMGLVAIFSGESASSGPKPRAAENVIRHVLTDRDTREVTFESLANQMSVTERQNQELREELNQLRMEMQSTRNTGVPSQITRELNSLGRELDLIREENRELRELSQGIDFSAIPLQDFSHFETDSDDQAVRPEPESAVPRNEADQGQESSGRTSGDLHDSDAIDIEEVFRSRPAPVLTPDQGQPGRQAATGAEGESAPGPQIISYYQQDPLSELSQETVEHPVYLPAGTIVSGVLLNGMDAPTNQGSRRDPFPASVRIKHEAILPNRFSADVKECFLIVSGYGDLSSERAYLRGETISCVTNDEDVIEAEVESYAVGEDGKSGIRGRLVSKQGALIARSMVAGFFSGASSAFNVSPIPVLNTTTDAGQRQYQSNYSSDLLQGAGAQGASQALDRIAQFYVDMAESIFPVIEVDAGRQVDVILTRGAELTIRDPENP